MDTVVLTHDIAEHGLEKGDISAIMHVHAEGEAVEVECVTAEEEPSRKAEDIRTMADREILHVREYLSAVQ